VAVALGQSRHEQCGFLGDGMRHESRGNER